MCETPHTTTNSRMWREFGWKNLTRFLITPKIKSRLSATEQSCWRACGSKEANHAHIFWMCPRLRSFWDDIGATIKDILGYEIPNESKTMYLGSVTGSDRYIVKLLMIATKKTISRNWYKTESPTIEQWLGILREIYCMERMTYQLRLKEDVSISKWNKWVLYDITKDM